MGPKRHASSWLFLSGAIALALSLLVGSSGAGTAGETAPRETRPPAKHSPTQPRLVEAYGKLPLSFEPNQGQTDPRVKFLSRGRGYTLFLTGNEAVLSLAKPSAVSHQLSAITRHSSLVTRHSDEVLRLQLVGASATAKASGLDELPGKSNYFIGNDPKKWRTNVPNYARVRYEQVYPGVDLVYYGNPSGDGRLEYDFVVEPGADPSEIQLRVETGNAKFENRNSKIAIDANGDLVIRLRGGELRFHKPVVYQEQGSGVSGQGSVALDNRQSSITNRKFLEGRYVLKGKGRIGFEVAAYDKTKPLIIDPVLSYSTYLGGSGTDQGVGIAVDSSGNAYVTGSTNSTNFPTANALQATLAGGQDAFVTKLDPFTALVYSTYLGGSGSDQGNGIAVDSTGNAYVTGFTYSTNFPTKNPLQSALAGAQNAFVTKLNATGSALVYSTYLGGSGNDLGTGIALDSSGNAYVTGGTLSVNFPTTLGAFQTAPGGGQDAFVTKLNAAGTALVYSTYLGGSGNDLGTGIALDSSANAYVTGSTASTNFPTASPIQAALGGPSDAFVTKLNAAGSALLYSTYLGGSGGDAGQGIAVDPSGNAYVTGFTASTNFPTASPIQATLGGSNDAFVTKLNAAGSALLYSTYLGGSGNDFGTGIALDSSGNAYVTGRTDSSAFPLSNAIQAANAGTQDVFITELNAAASGFVFSTYLGGTGGDTGTGIAVDSSGNAYVTGSTSSTDFPTTRTIQAAFRGGASDAFVVKISPANLPGVSLTPKSLTFASQAVTTTSAAQTVTLHNVGSAPLTISSITITGTNSGDFAQTNTCATGIAGGTTCTISVTFSPATSGTRTASISVTDNAAGSPQTVSLTGTGFFIASFSTTSINFGNQVVGTTSGPRTATLTNLGATPITISSIVPSGDFAQTNNCGASLAVSAVCNIVITFTPTTVGTRTGAITITDSAPLSPQAINLTGTGIASTAVATTCPATIASLRFNERYGKLPLVFEANLGQTDPQVKFLSRGRGYSLFLTGSEAVLELSRAAEMRKGTALAVPLKGQQKDRALATEVVRLKLAGANPAAHVTALDELPGKSNYFIGNDPKKWRADVPTYAKVRYEQVYPGVDLVYYGSQRELEYDFVVEPGADLSAIQLGVETRNPKAEIRKSKFEIDAKGDLVAHLDSGEVRFHKPIVYQEQESGARSQEPGVADNRQSQIDNRQFLDGGFVILADNRIGFEVGNYDRTRPLVIDPVLSYSTYLGGGDDDFAYGIAVDSSCNAYVTGYTVSLDFPTESPFQAANHGGADVFVTKLDPSGSSLIYSTYLGGSNDDVNVIPQSGIAIDSSGNAYVVGSTLSSDFPLKNPIQSTCPACANSLSDGFVTKLNATGSALVYSTYLGGSGGGIFGDGVAAIALDSSGNAYVTGFTASTNFPTVNPIQSTFGGAALPGFFGDAFVAKINPAGSALVYSTYLGGSGDDVGAGIEVDSSGNAYVSGITNSTNFPTASPLQPALGGGSCVQGTSLTTFPCRDAFVAKLNAAGSALVYSTYLGGNGDDGSLGLAIDSSGNAFATGRTNSTNFPTTAGAFQTALAPGGTCRGVRPASTSLCNDAFVTKLNASGSALVYSTYLGGSFAERGSSITVDSAGNAYVTGSTNSTNFPVASPVQSFNAGGSDAFLSKLNAVGSALIFSTYLGGSTFDQGFNVALDPAANAYVAGETDSTSFPTTSGAFQTKYGGDPEDAFVAKVSGLKLPVVSLSPPTLTFPSTLVGFTSAVQTATLTNVGDAALSIASVTTSGPYGQTNTCGSSVAPGASCTISVTFTPTFPFTQGGSVAISDNAYLSPQSVNLTGTGLPAPLATFSTAATVNFGNQVVGTTSGARTVVLVNTGSATLVVSSISTTGDFAQTNNCPSPPGGLTSLVPSYCQINVTFTPSATGSRSGTLTITDNTGASPHVINLLGNGIASSGPTTCPPTTAALHNFGKLPLGFVANRGQTDPEVKFVSGGRGYELFLTANEAVLSLRSQKPEVRSQLSAISGQLSALSGLLHGPRTTDNGQRTTDVLRLKLEGANPAANVSGLEELTGKSNYFIGSDPEMWQRDVPRYAKVRYEQVYPGIDLVYYGNPSADGQLEYDFVVAPGADPRAILLGVETRNPKFENRKSKIEIDAKGDLVAHLDGGEVRFHKPVVYQEQKPEARSQEPGVADNGPRTTDNRQSTIANRKFLDGRFVLLAGNRVGFEVGDYDRTRPLVIDPVLSYSTYLGGSNDDFGGRIAVDSSCNVYVAGATDSTDFPTTSGAYKAVPPLSTPTLCHTKRPCSLAFVTKLNPTGTALVYSTYLAGAGSSTVATALAVDSAGSAYVTGNTQRNFFSPSIVGSFPTTTGAFQTSLRGHTNGFVTKLTPAGDGLVYSTYLGGSKSDSGTGIAVDNSGNAYVTGAAQSSDFPTTLGAFQAASPAATCIQTNGTLKACTHPFVTKLNAAGTALVYSTFLGGTNNDAALSIAVDAAGSAYVTGGTLSTDFPTANAFKATTSGGTCSPSSLISHPCADGFVSKLKPDGSGLVYSTYLGGSADDAGLGITLDSAGSAYVTGTTNSKDFPTTSGAAQTAIGGGSCGLPPTITIDCPDAFITKLSATGNALVYSTYLGGAGPDVATGIAVDSIGNAYVTGGTISPNFPLASPVQAFLASHVSLCNFGGKNSSAVPIPCPDAFVSKVNSAGTALIFSTYLGGSGDDAGVGVAVDSLGNAYVAGITGSSDFPTTSGAFQTASGGMHDVFVTKLSGLSLPVASPSPTSLTFSTLGIGFTSTAQTVTLVNLGDAPLSIASIGATGDFAETNTCGTIVAAGANCTISVTFKPTATGSRTGTLTITNNAAGSPQTVSLSGSGVAAPAVSLSLPSLAFASQLVGSSSVAQTVTLTNTGTAALTLSGLTASGDFAETNTCGTSLAASGTCTISVTFKPTATGARSGTLTITDNAPGSPQTLALSGTGVQPAVSLSATSLTFKDTHVGSTCDHTGTAIVTNTGTGPLTVSSVTLSGDYVLLTNTCQGSVPAGGTCTVTANFVPTTTGTRTGTITITDNAPSSPQTVALTGNGLVPCQNITTSAQTAAVVIGTDATQLAIADPNPPTHSCVVSVTFACSGEAPAHCLFDPASIPPNSKTLLTVSNLKALQLNFLSFDVAGTSPPVPGVSGSYASRVRLTVLISDFWINNPAPSATVTAGQSANYALSAVPQNGLTGSVMFACSGAPAGAACTVTPASVTLDGSNPAQANVAVQTTARAGATPGPGNFLPPLIQPLGRPWTLALLGLLATGVVLLAKRWRVRAALAMGLGLIVLWAACGGGGLTSRQVAPAGTPAGTYNLTVTATYSAGPAPGSTQVSHTTNVILTVK